MSYSIYYDRAFIRAGSKFIPLANSGSNNGWEYTADGHSVPEKDWGVMNMRHTDKLLFSEDEIRDLAHIYDSCNQESGAIYIIPHPIVKTKIHSLLSLF